MGLSVIITSTSTLLVFIICLLWSFQLTVVGPALDAVSACVMDAAHLHIWSWAESGLNIQGVGNKAWRERGKKHGGFWLRRALLVIYGEDPSVLLCSVGSSDAGGRGKILGSRASKRWHQRLTLLPSTSPPPKTPNMPRILEDGLPVPLAFTLSGTNQRFYIHTQETNAVLTGIPDLSAPLTHLIVAEQTLLRQLTYFLASFDCTAQHISLFFLPPSLSLLYF